MVKMTAITAGLALVSGTAMAAAWVEVPDAGDALSGFQNTSGAGALNSITGSMDQLNLGDHVDAYCITITDATAFFASTDPNYGGSFVGFDGFQDDSRLFLFDLAGNLIMANDDDGTTAGSGSLESTIMNPGNYIAGGGLIVDAPGSVVNGQQYILAVSYFDNDLQDAGLVNVTQMDTNFAALVGQNPLAGAPNSWTNPGDFDAGWTYTIALAGATYSVPAPGALALLGTGGLMVLRRRR